MPSQELKKQVKSVLVKSNGESFSKNKPFDFEVELKITAGATNFSTVTHYLKYIPENGNQAEEIVKNKDNYSVGHKYEEVAWQELPLLVKVYVTSLVVYPRDIKIFGYLFDYILYEGVVGKDIIDGVLKL